MNTRSWTKRWLRWLYSVGASDPKKRLPTITADAEGFSVKSRGSEAVVVPFSQLRTIHAFKRDLITEDLVCFLIELNDGRRLEIDEEMPGFIPLSHVLERIPGFDARWRENVIQPAFETKWTQIFPK